MGQPKSTWPAASIHPELVKLGNSGLQPDLRSLWGCSGSHRQRCHLTMQEREAELQLERREHQAMREMHHETCVRYGLPITDASRRTTLAVAIKLHQANMSLCTTRSITTSPPTLCTTCPH